MKPWLLGSLAKLSSILDETDVLGNQVVTTIDFLFR